MARELGVEYDRDMGSEALAEEIATFEVTKSEPVIRTKKKVNRDAEKAGESAWEDVAQMSTDEFLQQLYGEEQEDADIPQEDEALESVEMGEELTMPEAEQVDPIEPLQKELAPLAQQATEEKPKKKLGTIRKRGAGRIPGGRKKR